ncbi:hypothetical protein JCM10213_004656 [Rhodosporidiobolus nylandii]
MAVEATLEQTQDPADTPASPSTFAEASAEAVDVVEAAPAGQQDEGDQATPADAGKGGQADEGTDETLEILADPPADDAASSSPSGNDPTSSSNPQPSLPSSAPPSPPLAPADDTPAPAPARQPIRLPPPPARGILRPPSSSHAGPSSASRFSFKRDVLLSLSAGAPAGAVAGGVQEAVGSAASAAGGFLGSAFKRLSVAAGAAAAGSGVGAVQEQAFLAGGAASGSVDSLASSTPLLPSLSASSSVAPTTPQQPPQKKPSHPLPVSDLRRVRFRVGQAFSITYPINRGTLEPIAPSEEAITRNAVEAAFRARPGAAFVAGTKEKGKAPVEGPHAPRQEKGKEEGGKQWIGEELMRLYAECCRLREEPGIEKVKKAFRENPSSPPRTLDLSGILLTVGAVETLADLLSVDWGCRKLVLDGCGLDDESLKPLLHALLVSACIPTLSLANNKRIKQKGWRLVAVFVRKASFLRYVDLSDSSLDRRAAEWLVQALNPPPAPPPAPAPPPPPPKPEPSASTNGAKKLGAGAEAKPKKVKGPWDDDSDSDSEDEAERTTPSSEAAPELADEDVKSEAEADEPPAPPPAPLFDAAPLLKDEEEPAEGQEGSYGAVSSLRVENCGLRGGVLEALANGVRTSHLKHISLRRNRINAQGAVQLAVMIRDYPLSSSSSSSTELAASSSMSSVFSSNPPIASPSLWAFGNGSAPSNEPPSFPSNEPSNTVTARQQRPLPPPPADGGAREMEDEDDERPTNPAALAEREAWRLSEARVRLQRQVDEMPRVGALLTLDVKANDLRNGVTYIAQVLKRNRTLKVLNLSENKVEAQGLVAIAEALKYNTSLETLDLSFNPCCALLDGVLALRSAMMVSSTLKRVFLNSTGLTSEGAIALAEFLPEARSVIHLDLTANDVDISGVLALAVSLKMNRVIRCLDLDIPFDDPDFSRLSQSILETCVRNTELAQQEAEARARASEKRGAGHHVQIAQPIRKSALASNLEAQQRQAAERQKAREEAKQTQVDIFAAAAGTRDVVAELLGEDQKAASQGVIVKPSEVVKDALVQLQLAEAQLSEAFGSFRREEQRERAEILLTELASLFDLAKSLYDKPQPPTPSPATNGRDSASHLAIPPPAAVEQQPSSPTFSITSSDSEDEDEASPPAAAPSPPSADTTLELSTSLSPPASPSAPSPIEVDSRAMVAEESLVFRKGLALGVDDVPSDSDSDGEGEYAGEREVSGEELKREILEAPEEEVEEGRARRGSRGSFSAEDAERPRIEQDDGAKAEGEGEAAVK